MDFLNLKDISERYRSELKEAAAQVIDSGYYIRGPKTEEFESSLCRYLGCKNTVGTGNGLDALKLIFRAYIELGVMSVGDEVILPANTFIASLTSVVESGLKPVIADIDAETQNIDIAAIESIITPRTKAIMPVHLYGRCCWSEELKSLAQQYNLKIVEDNAQAMGAKSAIKGFGESILNGIKSFFGIHSPSRVFRDEIGSNLALGLGEGFTKEMNSVSNMMEDSIPTDFNVGMNANVDSLDFNNNSYSKDNLVTAFQQALSGMTIKISEDLFGELVIDKVEKVVYG